MGRRWLLLLSLGLTAAAGCDTEGRERGADSEQQTGSPAPGDASLPIDVSLSSSADTAPTPDPAPAGDPADVRAARQVIEAYYGAIDAGDYERAYGYWGDDGRASGQTYLEFVAGFAATADVEVDTGDAGRVEGAAGSRYVAFPVVVSARRDDGERQRFEGRYTLRRGVVDGATEAQRRWHLYDASLRQVR